MSKLIYMRQRIQSIETTKKITEAMRLISMSTHSRLKHKQPSLAYYVSTLEHLFYKLIYHIPHYDNPLLHPPLTSTKTLLIIIGSQKGLCGTFNTTLFNQLTIHANPTFPHNNVYIAVGKKAIDELNKSASHTVIATYEPFSSHTFLTIAHTIVNHIVTQTPSYAQVIIVSNKAPTFFIQKPEQTILIPFLARFPTLLSEKSSGKNNEQYNKQYTEEYDINSLEQILPTFIQYYLEAHLERLLYESLVAEQAARFISMDNATRNAQRLLDETTLHYHKARQARITKELTELIGSF